jgi:uncharacterized protein YjbJ (UPF0337 family)
MVASDGARGGLAALAGRQPQIGSVAEPIRLSVVDPCKFNMKDFTMSSTTDKIKGVTNEAVGNVKQGIGKATDNDRLRAEGKAQEIKGEAQQAVGKAKDAVKNIVDKA